MPNEPNITCIICSYNRAGYLYDTLQSLLELTPADAPVEWLVVDNNSTDATPEIVGRLQKAYPKDEHPIRYIKEPNQGLSHARNRGIREARAPHIVFLDDDIRATKALIPSWISFFDRYPDAEAAGGKIHVQFDDPRPGWMSHFLLPLLGHHDLGNRQKKYPSGKYPFGGNMGFKKSIFQKVGLFDTDLGRKGTSLNAGEEKELFHRLRDRNAQIYYLPDAFLYHRVNSDRLTVDYIRKQALGLGQSMKLRLGGAPASKKAVTWAAETGKLLGSVPLAFFYLLKLQPAKAAMLFKFRRWIRKGYKQDF